MGGGPAASFSSIISPHRCRHEGSIMSASDRLPAAEASAEGLAPPSKGSRRLLPLLVTAALVLLAVLLGLLLSRREPTNSTLHTVGRGNIVVRCEFPATLISTNVAEITCNVAARPDQEGQSRGAELLWVAANGQRVKVGDLLAEFDATGVRDSLDAWQLKTIKSEGVVEQTSLRVRNEQSKRDTQLANAAKKLELMLTADEETNTFQKTEIRMVLTAIERAREGTKSTALNADYIQALERLGLTAQRITGKRPKSSGQPTTAGTLADAVNRFTRLTSSDENSRTELAAAVIQMHRALVESQSDYELRMETLSLEQKAATNSLEQQRRRTAYYEQQLANCTIQAPINGVVQHVIQDTEEGIVEPGMLLREGRKILVVHDLSQMSLVATVDVPAARYLTSGMTASIRFQVRGKASVRGTITAVEQREDVVEVAVTPDTPSPYPPGTSAEIDVVARRCENVVRIPVTALHRWDGEYFCFVPSDAGLEQQPLTVGVIARRYAEVVEGLSVGDSVVSDAAAVAEKISAIDQ
jgi:multidrug resistance efflux pump